MNPGTGIEPATATGFVLFSIVIVHVVELSSG
jgi:hypothetical protein